MILELYIINLYFKELDFLFQSKKQYVCVCVCVCVLVAHLCLTLCDPMNCCLPGSSFHGILQTRILDWVVIPFSRESSRLRDQTQVPCLAGRFFTI